jgi:hypothetical protein
MPAIMADITSNAMIKTVFLTLRPGKTDTSFHLGYDDNIRRLRRLSLVYREVFYGGNLT